MNGIDLFRLGRRLMKLGIESLPPSGFQSLPSSFRMVLTDVFENPDSSISEITSRTGFPQSHVSAAVAKFRDAGVFVTTIDPSDRRRTLVRRSPQSEAAAGQIVAPIEPALQRALTNGDDHLDEILQALELLSAELMPLHTRTAELAHTTSSPTVGS